MLYLDEHNISATILMVQKFLVLIACYHPRLVPWGLEVWELGVVIPEIYGKCKYWCSIMVKGEDKP